MNESLRQFRTFEWNKNTLWAHNEITMWKEHSWLFWIHQRALIPVDTKMHSLLSNKALAAQTVHVRLVKTAKAQLDETQIESNMTPHWCSVVWYSTSWRMELREWWLCNIASLSFITAAIFGHHLVHLSVSVFITNSFCLSSGKWALNTMYTWGFVQGNFDIQQTILKVFDQSKHIM